MALDASLQPRELGDERVDGATRGGIILRIVDHHANDNAPPLVRDTLPAIDVTVPRLPVLTRSRPATASSVYRLLRRAHQSRDG